MAVLWQACPGGARVLRVLGDSPCPALPDTVDSRPVTELGPYCFAARPVSGGTLWPPQSADTHEVTGDFVEEITLPDSVRTLHAAAFYNCRRLRRLTLGAGVHDLGSDLFTNCKALQTLALRAAPDAATGAKKLLGAVSADITLEFTAAPGARLFYPEYFEWLDENTPAHIFNHSIEGEGYRMRQCFADGAVDYPAYDASFAQACVGETPEKLCRLALGRLLYPFALSAAARTAYEAYLTDHAPAAFAQTIAARDLPALRLLAALPLPRTDAAALCARAAWPQGAAVLLGHGSRQKKTYDFDDL